MCSPINISPLPVVYANHELAWAAGFFDGEGTFGCYKNYKHYVVIRASIPQDDYDPLERFQKAVRGLGTIHGSRRSGRLIFEWKAQSFEEVQAIIALLWKYLCEPKRKQAVKTLLDYRASRVYILQTNKASRRWKQL